MNKIILIGNISSNPESGKTSNDVQYCKFNIAVNRDYKDADGNRVADFISIVCWKGLADIVFKHLKKGVKVAITGKLQTKNYKNKEGVTVYSFDVIAEELEFLQNKEKQANDTK